MPDRPRFLVGYSFGAGVALGVDDPAVAAMVADRSPAGRDARAPTADVPTLLLVPALDQYSPPAVVGPLVAGWPAATVEPVAGADHFLVGHTAAVADRATEWLTAQAVAP